jgi:hypothetical protein
MDSSVGKDSYDPATVGNTMVQASRDEYRHLAEARMALAKYDLHAECVLIGVSRGERREPYHCAGEGMARRLDCNGLARAAWCHADSHGIQRGRPR